MTKVVWDQVGQRFYETGVDHGVLYIPDGAGVYNSGFAWNGLTLLLKRLRVPSRISSMLITRCT
jgi:hypothetical protein